MPRGVTYFAFLGHPVTGWPVSRWPLKGLERTLQILNFASCHVTLVQKTFSGGCCKHHGSSHINHSLFRFWCFLAGIIFIKRADLLQIACRFGRLPNHRFQWKKFQFFHQSGILWSSRQNETGEWLIFLRFRETKWKCTQDLPGKRRTTVRKGQRFGYFRFYREKSIGIVRIFNFPWIVFC